MGPRLLLVLIALLAGCVAPAGDAPGAAPTAPTEPTPGAGASAPDAPALGERAPVATERFVLRADHTLGTLDADAPEEPLVEVAERLSPLAFFTSAAQAPQFEPWLSAPFQSAWESTADIDVTLSVTSSAAATATTPRAIGFTGVGCWLGTVDRFAMFTTAPDAPDTMDGATTYPVHLRFPTPQGGFFVLAGEQLALHCFVAYQTADGSPASYVVGGPAPAGFELRHQHFNLSAPRAIVVLEESGELQPNPSPSGSEQREPAEFALEVPSDALYVVLEISGASKTGGQVDLDASVRSQGGDLIAGGSSPYPVEKVIIGPGNLAAYGRSLVVRATSSSNAAGAVFALKATAYAP